MFGKLDENLKRKSIWPSVEVHAIYALFYILCMSREGIKELRNYLGANDTSIFDPIFIAQYLFCPVNTIVKDGLTSWMMKKFFPSAKPGTQLAMGDQHRSKVLKSELYLKYSLLVDMMKIVKKHGREPAYNWEEDPDLTVIRNGEFGGHEAAKNKLKVILAFDGFTSIWLLTLPEKFKEWYEYHMQNNLNQPGVRCKVLNLTEKPTFPIFDESHSKLDCNPITGYKFLPKTWNLMTAFEYFLRQEALWLTKSITNEVLAVAKKKNTPKKTRTNLVDAVTLHQDISDEGSVSTEDNDEEEKIEHEENNQEESENGEEKEESGADKQESGKDNKESEEDSEDEDSDVKIVNPEELNVASGTTIDEHNEEETSHESPSGQKRRRSNVSASTHQSPTGTKKKMRKNVAVTFAAASATILVIASRLDTCYTKVLQLEQENDDEVKAELVQDLK